MQATDFQTLSNKLESIYTMIEKERMDDVPILNKALSVKAIGFCEWDTHIMGVMLTPWFMNLMLLPGKEEDWSELISLSKTSYTFPSGKYEFIVGEEEGIGKYQMCSLFSPVFEFQDQETAIVTAEAVMDQLMDEINQSDISTRQKEIESVWRGETQAEQMKEEVELDENRTTLKERVETPMSRREMLRGDFLVDKSEQA
jgi:[NiFe] hydrogenase assembly HybE family chaperone